MKTLIVIMAMLTSGPCYAKPPEPVTIWDNTEQGRFDVSTIYQKHGNYVYGSDGTIIQKQGNNYYVYN